jgi:hypothetical protein
MHTIINGKNDNWNYIGKWWLKKYDQIYNTEYFFTTCSDFKGLQIYILPIHYKGEMININLEILEKHVKLSA